MVFLCALGVAVFSSTGTQLNIWMHSLRRCDFGFFNVLGVAGFVSRGILLITWMRPLSRCDCSVFVCPWCCWICL